MAGRWLTPDTPPEHKQWTRLVHMPAALDFIAPVSGALLAMTYPSNWEQHGTLTPEETAAIYSDIYQQFLDFQNEPPDWTTPDDLDGQPEQPWYEELADWIIAGFLAYTFTYQAAIVYTTTVPKLRVAFRTGNIGALFRVLINGIEVWTGDSYDVITDVIEQIFDMSAETEPYTVRIEHNGIGAGHGLTEAKLEYIRQGALADMVATILRADPNGCGVQWSTDDGGTWDTIDLSTCIAGIADDRIIQAIEDGTIPSGGQAPQSPPEPEQCRTYHVKMAANSAWVCPSPVSSGTTVEVANVVGAWNDGEAGGALGPWYCPTGNSYALGICGENDGNTDAGDPLNSVYHMRLVGHVTTWFDAFSQFAVPDGVNDAPLVFQANDSALGDNLGEIEFDVTVCTASANIHCFEWDFTTGKQTFDNHPNPINSVVYGVYTAGIGFVTDGNLVSWVGSDEPFPALVLSAIELDLQNNGDVTVNNLGVWADAGQLFSEFIQNTSGSFTYHKDWSTTWQAGKHFWINIGVGANSCTLRKMRLYFSYPGNPFGADNCEA